MKRSTGRTIAIAAALLMILAGAAGSFAIAGSGMSYESDKYTATFGMNSLKIHLLENGKDVSGGKNDQDPADKITGNLATSLGYKGEGELGTFDPGKMYREEVAAQNGEELSAFVRMTVKKYWIDPETGDKVPTLSPNLIKLQYKGNDYNTGAWTLNEEESTTESQTYYCKEAVAPGKTTALLFDTLYIDNRIATDCEESESFNEETGITTKTYTYRYDGCAFMIQADVQGIQTHNANDAIASQWGIDNVKADEAGTSLTVN